MITYANELTVDNVVYSIDMLIVDFNFLFVDGESLINTFLLHIERNLDLQFDNWISTKFATFRSNFSFKISDDVSFWVGVGFNGSDLSDTFKARIEFNPNKVFNTYDFRFVFNLLHKMSKSCSIKRFDVAIDYPMLRENCYLIKDNRKYREDRRSYKDRTQYLGTRNNHGFVKLYNKMVESKLNYALTRLEITVDYQSNKYSHFVTLLPEVYVLEDLQLAFDELGLNDTDRFILYSIVDNLDNIKMLGRGKRKKIECILSKYTQKLKVDIDTYNELVHSLEMYLYALPFEKVFNPFTLRNELLSNAVIQ